MDRSAYVKEAGAEISFYLLSASKEPSFFKQLSQSEKEQLQGIHEVLAKLKVSPKFIFSDNPADFILSPGEPERSAKTTEILEDPIWINTRKLGLESVDYLSVVQLLVHELGHKLGPKKNQQAVDSLATKVRSYLSAFYVKEPVYLRLSFGSPRPLQESFEFLSLPKQIGSFNPNPTLFYLSKTKAWPISLRFKDSLKKQAKDRFVRVHRVYGLLDSGAIDATVSLSISKQFILGDGRQIYSQEGAYKISEPMPFLDAGPSDVNFSGSRLALSYPLAPLEQSVKVVRQVAREPRMVQWEVTFSAEARPQTVALVAGTRERPFLAPCAAPKGVGGDYLVSCTLKLGSHAAISVLDIFQLLVDGRSVDLPGLIELDLEDDFKLGFDLSDTKPVKIETVGQAYHLTMKGTYAPIQVRVRCLEEKPFFYGSERLGTITAFAERLYFEEELPLTQVSANEYTVKAACEGGGKPAEILVTDGLFFTSNPRF